MRALRSGDRALAAVLGVWVVAMLAGAALLGTWQDEEYTLATTARGVGYAFHRAIDYELQAPLYFVALAAFRTFASSVLWARVFSVACAAGFVYATTRLARRIAPERPVWPVAALVALNPFTIFAALEIRVYAMALLLGALCWLAFDDGFFRGASTRARVAFATLAIVALYTQYFIAFEFVAFGVGLVVVGRLRALGAYALAGCVVALAFAPMLLVLRSQIAGAVGVHDTLAPSLARVFVHPAFDFVFPLDYQGVTGGLGRGATLIALTALGVAVLAARPRVDRTVVAYVVMAVSVEAIYVMLVDVWHETLVSPRHYFALALPEFAALYALLAGARGPRAPFALASIAVLLGCAALASDVTTYRAGAKPGDWKRVGAYLSRVARPGDTIAIDEPDALPSFARSYRGEAHVVAFPRTLSPDRYDLDAMIVHSEAEAEAALARLPRAGRVWFVDYGACDRFDRLGCNETHAALARRERVIERVTFYQNAVLLLAPRRGVTGP